LAQAEYVCEQRLDSLADFGQLVEDALRMALQHLKRFVRYAFAVVAVAVAEPVALGAFLGHWRATWRALGDPPQRRRA
jgi:hypothetical protein